MVIVTTTKAGGSVMFKWFSLLICTLGHICVKRHRFAFLIMEHILKILINTYIFSILIWWHYLILFITNLIHTLCITKHFIWISSTLSCRFSKTEVIASTSFATAFSFILFATSAMRRRFSISCGVFPSFCPTACMMYSGLERNMNLCIRNRSGNWFLLANSVTSFK